MFIPNPGIIHQQRDLRRTGRLGRQRLAHPGLLSGGTVLVKIAPVYLPQHFLYFLPLPQGQWSLRLILGVSLTSVLSLWIMLPLS